MKRILNHKGIFYCFLGFSVCLMVTGFLLVSFVFNKYDSLLRSQLDHQMLRLTGMVDESLESYLGRYVDNLILTTDYRDIRNSQLSPAKGFADILFMREEEVLRSATKRTNYYFPEQEYVEGEIALRPCIGEEGKVYLAFLRRMEDDLQYAALVDMEQFYRDVAGNLTGLMEPELILMDRYGQMLVHRKNDGVHIDRIIDISEGDREYVLLSFMKEQQMKTEEGTLLYQTISDSTGRSYQARMVVIPVDLAENGYFSLGMSVNYDREVLPLKMTVVFMGAAAAVLLLGILLLFVLLLKSMESSRQTRQEMKDLEEKNAAMEELNRQTQKLAHHQRLEIIGMLTSGIAHEFNNMLTPIMGYSMMILEKLPQDDTEIYDEVLEIYQMSAKAKTVISRLSDLSRKNTGNVFQKIPVDELVRRMVSAARAARPNHVDVQLELKCPKTTVYGNETQLSQLLLNLILNSYHALEDQGGTLEILTNTEGETVHITVRDNGYGISKENLSHIFEPFFTTKEAGKGTGLGMAIVAQVVEEHSGKIHVDSIEGEGTSICVSLPTIM